MALRITTPGPLTLEQYPEDQGQIVTFAMLETPKYTLPPGTYPFFILPNRRVGEEALFAVRHTVKNAVKVLCAKAREWIGSGAVIRGESDHTEEFVLYYHERPERSWKRLPPHGSRVTYWARTHGKLPPSPPTNEYEARFAVDRSVPSRPTVIATCWNGEVIGISCEAYYADSRNAIMTKD